MKYYLIAGEASGDLHGSNLMKALLNKDPNAEFRFWGGNKMINAGGTQVEHYKNTAFMGFWEVITNLKSIFGFLKKCKQDINDYQPDCLILIDYPGFNLRIAEWAKKNTICKIVYYISPQVWAWKESRVKKIKRSVHKMLVILPFEKDFYKKHNYEVEFVGHPLLDEIEKKDINQNRKEKIIALLPGSRKQEIKQMLPEYLKVINHFPEYQFIIAGLSNNGKAFYEHLIDKTNVSIEYDTPYELLAKSKFAIVTSGTATLETALFKVPMVVCYRGSWFSYQIGKQLVKIDYIALVNLIMDRKVVSELIQNEMTSENIKTELLELMKPEIHAKLNKDYNELWNKLGDKGASERAAETIVKESGA